MNGVLPALPDGGPASDAMGHRPPRFPALAIVPAHAQRRVALAVAAIVGALAALGYALRAAPVAAAGVLAAGLGAGAYVDWCLWPRLRVGVARDLLDDLPCPPGQRVRLTVVPWSKREGELKTINQQEDTTLFDADRWFVEKVEPLP